MLAGTCHIAGGCAKYAFSGWSGQGVLVGVILLIVAYAAYKTIFKR